VLGGTVPDEDRAQLQALGIARVFTAADGSLAEMVAALQQLASPGAPPHRA